MSLTSSMEDYLEAVLVLQKQKGYARCVDVSEFFRGYKALCKQSCKRLSKKEMFAKKRRWHTLFDRARTEYCETNL